MSAYEMAVATIRQERHTLSLVVETLRRLLRDIERQHAQPDFALFAGIVNLLPRKLRMHAVTAKTTDE